MHRSHFVHYALSIAIALTSVLALACDDDDSNDKGTNKNSLSNGGDSQIVNSESGNDEGSSSEAGTSESGNDEENSSETGNSESGNDEGNNSETGNSETGNSETDQPKTCVTTDDCDTTIVAYTDDDGRAAAYYNEVCVGGICLNTCLKGADTVKDCTGAGEVCAIIDPVLDAFRGVCMVPHTCETASDCDVFARESCLAGICAVDDMRSCDDIFDGYGSVDGGEWGADANAFSSCVQGGKMWVPSLIASFDPALLQGDYSAFWEVYPFDPTEDDWYSLCQSLYDAGMEEIKAAFPGGCD